MTDKQELIQETIVAIQRAAGVRDEWSSCLLTDDMSELIIEALRSMTEPNFDAWWSEIENYGTRGERALDDLGPDAKKWLEAAYISGAKS